MEQLDFGEAVFETRGIENDIRRIEDNIRHRAVWVMSRSGALAAETAGDARSTATCPRFSGRDFVAGITAISPVSPAADKANAADIKFTVALVDDDGSESRTLPSPTGFP